MRRMGEADLGEERLEVAWLSGSDTGRATNKQQELSKQSETGAPPETWSHGQALMLYLKSLLIQFYMICWLLNVKI